MLIKIYKYLQERFKINKNYSSKNWEYIDDQRKIDNPKVSIIVSLYNAEDKLLLFLESILHQTLYKKDQVEIILVDSGSPTSEKNVFDEFQKKENANILYARSKERETIQSAWNRGIKIAKSPYLVFLGVDETLYPNALEILSNELISNPEIDWVMSDSLVTEVDEKGL